MTNAVKRHWPEYLMEACGLGLFMTSASGFAIVLFHPAAPGAVLGPLLRRALMGLAMGLTAISLIYSPWGSAVRRSLQPSRDADIPAARPGGAVGRRIVCRRPVRRWRRGIGGRRGGGRESRRSAVGELRGDAPGAAWDVRRVPRRARDRLRDDDDGPDHDGAPAPARSPHRAPCRGARRRLHHPRGSAVGDEPQPGPEL